MSSSDDHSQYEYESSPAESATVIGSSSAKFTSVVGSGKKSIATAENLSSEKSVEELRSSPRKQYQVNQRIAPMHKDLPPHVDEYFNVECNDISQGGISFYLKRPAGCEKFAIALGQKPLVTVLIGRVVYSREINHNGDQMYLVGCQFVGRLKD
jgi:hypothetical protein